MNQSTFDFTKSQALKEAGIKLALSNNVEWLQAAREVAADLCLIQGSVTADDVRYQMEVKKNWFPTTPNAYGGVFKDKRFEFTGRYTKSSAVSRHAGMQRVWRLK